MKLSPAAVTCLIALYFADLTLANGVHFQAAQQVIAHLLYWN